MVLSFKFELRKLGFYIGQTFVREQPTRKDSPTVIIHDNTTTNLTQSNSPHTRQHYNQLNSPTVDNTTTNLTQSNSPHTRQHYNQLNTVQQSSYMTTLQPT